MKKITYVVLFIALLSLQLMGCSEKNENIEFVVYEEDNYIISKYAKILKAHSEHINFEESGYDDIGSMLLDIDDYIESISKYIDRENWKDNYTEKHGTDYEFRIRIGLTQGASHVKGGYNHFVYLPLEIKFNEGLLENNQAPIAHEITHLIAPYYSSLTLREGLASLIQDEIGKNSSVFNFGKSAHVLSKKYLENDNIYREIIASIGTEGIPENLNLSKTNIETRKAYYLLSYSFSKYLIDQFGIKKFMEAYESENLLDSYLDLYDKNLQELRNDWIEYIVDYEEE